MSRRGAAAASGGYPGVFADASWEQVIEACQNDAVPESWAVGDQKTMTIGGADYAVDIIGKHHDALYVSNSAVGETVPLTLQLHGSYGTKYAIEPYYTNNIYVSSKMHTVVLPAIIQEMPAEVQAALRSVGKKATAGYVNGNGIYYYNMKAFLIAASEAMASSYGPELGPRYAYYAQGGSTIKTFAGSPAAWWSRSSVLNMKSQYYAFHSSQESVYGGAASSVSGLAFAFCL